MQVQSSIWSKATSVTVLFERCFFGRFFLATSHIDYSRNAEFTAAWAVQISLILSGSFTIEGFHSCWSGFRRCVCCVVHWRYCQSSSSWSEFRLCQRLCRTMPTSCVRAQRWWRRYNWSTLSPGRSSSLFVFKYWWYCTCKQRAIQYRRWGTWDCWHSRLWHSVYVLESRSRSCCGYYRYFSGLRMMMRESSIDNQSCRSKHCARDDQGFRYHYRICLGLKRRRRRYLVCCLDPACTIDLIPWHSRCQPLCRLGQKRDSIPRIRRQSCCPKKSRYQYLHHFSWWRPTT